MKRSSPNYQITDVRTMKLNRAGHGDSVDIEGVREKFCMKMKRASLDDQDTDEWGRKLKKMKLNRARNGDSVDTEDVREKFCMKMKRASLDDQDTDEWGRKLKKMRRQAVSCVDNESKYDMILNEKMNRLSLDDQASNAVKRKIIGARRWFSDGGSMRQLPDDLVFEILAWLPVENLDKCKLMSQHWLSIISSESFQKVYMNRQGMASSSLAS